MAIYKSVSELAGNTPLFKAERYAEFCGVKANVLAKLEYFNPAGSVKDRVAVAMINDAEKSGKLRSGGTIIEPKIGRAHV